MNDLQVFKYQDSEVRTIEMNGEPWFVLKDVCKVLAMDVTQLKKTADRLDADEKGRTQITTPGGVQETWVINESGLYNVILRSDKPEAKPFRKWVTSEVLPTIRKHGAYMTPETLQEVILNPDMMIQLCQQLKAEQDKNAALKVVNSRLTVDNQIMQPKADYFDELVERNLNTGIRETAKLLGIGQKEFVAFLQDKKYLYRDKRGRLMPYMDKNNGLFEVKECFNNKTNWAGTQVLITPKGRETFRLLYLQGKKAVRHD
jgi:prophage antirepressor-like protein|nr:MAG TPA: repressor domain protein [Caudoviricetes sp.]